MDGLTALRIIMQESPTNVIMLSSLTSEGSHAALKALELGAADILAKDMSQVSLSVTNVQDELLQKVRALAGSKRLQRPAQQKAVEHHVPVFKPGQFDVVCIGSSTGGPPILEQILTGLPESMTVPVVVAQHMPEIFTRSMSERLRSVCALPVVHAEDQMPLKSGHIYIAPGEKNIHINKQGLARWDLHVNHEPANTFFWPSVDAMLLSAAKATGQRTLAVILTGIGEDGLQGARALFQQGASILAQSEETCVVYGMPKAVAEKALVLASLSPAQIAQSLQSLANKAATPVLRAS
jgi:two-component system chemotaxis response regulator CheB